MIQSSAAFQAAQAAPSSEPRYRLKAVLTDVASASLGSTATSSGDFSADFPPTGVIDGVLHHLNFGPAVTAEDRIGRSGWKSPSQAATQSVSGRAAWATGGTWVWPSSQHVEATMVFPTWNQDFHFLAAGPLVPQDGFSTVVLGGNIDVGIPPAFTGRQMEGKALRLFATGTGRVRRTIALGTPLQAFSWVMGVAAYGSGGVNTFVEIILRDNGAGVDRFAIRLDSTGAFLVGVPGALLQLDALETLPVLQVRRLSLEWDATVPAASPVRLWLDYGNGDAYQARAGTFDMTGVTAIDFSVARAAAGGTDVWLDDFRMGQQFSDLVPPTQDNVLDFGVAPQSGRAVLTTSGYDDRLNTYLGGSSYGFQNRTANRTLRAAGPLNVLVAQTFTPSSSESFYVARLSMLRAGTAADRNVWLELRQVVAGQPTAQVLAVSRLLPVASVPAAQGTVEFTFPVPYVLTAGVQYALVLAGDFVAGSVTVGVGFDGTAPTYAGGQVWFSNDGIAWIAAAGEDLVFQVITRVGIELECPMAGRDSSVMLGGSAAEHSVAQGFKVPVAVKAQHFHVLLRRHQAAAFAATDRFRVELRAEGAANQPGTTILAQGVDYDPAVVDWGGTEGAPVWREFCVSLTHDYLMVPGTRYFLVLRPSWAASAANHLDVGVDASAPPLADGVLCTGTDAAEPVWTPDATKDATFELNAHHRPFVRWEAAFSSDGIAYSAFQTLYDNPERLGSLSGIPVQGQALRYWKVRANIRYRPQTTFPNLPWTPQLTSYSVKLAFATVPWVTVAFGQARTVSRIEVLAHPIERGAAAFRLSSSTDGIVFLPISSFSALEARKRGGAATVSSVGDRIETSGDYVGADLAADLVGVTHIRIEVLDNVDEWARLVELRAFRVVDFGDRVLGDPGISATADFVQRKFPPRQLSLSLDNTDGMLSPLGTVSPYADQLGEGVKLVFESGYREAVDLVRHGEFYVDNWKEDPKTCIVTVSARDILARADTRVTSRYKVNKRSWEIVEYLLNLANIPSQWLQIDRTGNRIKYFAAAEPNAWQEANKVCEAAGFADLRATADGYAVFRASGTSAGDTGVPTEPTGIAGSLVTNGPPVLFTGKLYVLSCANTPGDVKTCRLLEYDQATGTWVSLFLVDSWTNPGDTGTHAGGYLFPFGDELLILYQSFTTVTGGFVRMVSWPGTGATTTFRGQWNPNLFTYAIFPSYQQEPVLMVGRFIYLFPLTTGSMLMYRIDALTGEFRRTSFPAFTGLVEASGLLVESGKMVLLTNADTAPGSPGALKVYEVEPVAPSLTLRATVDVTTRAFVSGAASTGKGWFYFVNQRLRFTPYPEGAEIPARVTKVDVGTWAVTQGDAIFSDAKVAIVKDQGALAYIDGQLVGGALQAETTRRLVMGDEDSARATSPGSFTLGSSRVLGFASFTIGGQSWVYGVIDDTKVVEFQVRRRKPAQETPVISLTSGPDGLLLGASLDHGTDMGGDNRIINVATVKSEPLIDFPPEIVWSADKLPWTTAPGKLIFRVKLKDPSLNQAPSITTAPVGAATVSTDGDANQPEITITVTAACNITALTITGRPLRKAGTLVAAAVGGGWSIEKFGIRHEQITNDYVYDLLAAAPMAAGLVLAYQDKKAKVEGVQTLMLTNLELLDLVRIVDTRTGLDRLFFVTGYRHQYRSHRSSLTVLQK